MVNIDKFRDAPKRLGMHRTREGIFYRRNWRSDYHKVGDYHSYDIAKRILKKNYQKPFDKAFSYFCSIVPKYQQCQFLDLFNATRRWSFDQWYIDENGLIQNYSYEKVKDKKVHKLYTADYMEGWVHKITGAVMYQRPSWTSEHKYNHVVLSGEILTFESKNDPRYKRIVAESNKIDRKNRRELRKMKSEKAYCMLTSKELEIRKEAENDLIKIQSHGFNEDSFKGEEYHGQKRKKKNK